MSVLDRNIFWVPWRGPGMEHLRLRAEDGGFKGTGVVLGVHEGVLPFRLHYRIKCDHAWRTRKVILELHTPHERLDRTLRSDGVGRWYDESQAVVPALDGCFDIDISATPFTNTLAIRRLDLSPGSSAGVRVAYVAAPSVDFRAVDQRYTCRMRRHDAATLTYEGLFRGFKADLAVDADGLILDYPDTFRRLFPI